MARFEVHVEALLMNEEEAEALRERAKSYRRQKAESSHKQILKNVAKHALSLTPPRSTPPSSKPTTKTPSHLLPLDEAPSSSYLPRKLIYTNPQKQSVSTPIKEKKQPKKKQQQSKSSPKNNNSSMPVTKIGVMSYPKPLSPISSSPPDNNDPVSPLQTYEEWKNRQSSKKKLPNIWKQVDTPPMETPQIETLFGEDEEETKIELPESLREREEMVVAAQKKNDNNELIPVDPSKSFEKFHLHPTPTTTSTSASSNESLSSTLSPPNGISSGSDMSSYYSTASNLENSSDTPTKSTQSRSSTGSKEALSPPCLIVPKTINALAANNIGKVYITDKFSDLDKLVLATAFSPVPVKQKQPKHAGKSKSDFAIHRGNRSPFKSLFKRSSALKKAQSMEPLTTKFPPQRNIDVCKQYEIVKAVRFPNSWLDEMEAIAIIVFLLAVIALLFYRSLLIGVVA